LELLAAGIRELPLLQGWRFEVFGKDALDLVEGKMAFAVVNGRLKMTRIEAPAREPEAQSEPEAEPLSEPAAEDSE
jgi:ribonuclease D